MIKDPDVQQLALKGLRVLEVGSGAALAYAGKLFADFGAEVIKAEPLAGDVGRSMPPLVTTAQGQDSALFAWLNTHKRSLCADWSQSSEQAWLGQLARSCDVVLDARALKEGLTALDSPVWQWGGGTSADVDSATLSKELIGVDFTWFGDSGPYKDYVATESTCRAMAAAVHGSGPKEGPPHMPHDLHTAIVGGLGGFSLALAAWIGREQGGRRYLLSLHETAFCTVEMEAGMVQDKRHAPRLGVNRFGTTHPASILRTRDGWIGIFTNTLAQWAGLCDAIERPDLADDPRFANGPERMKHADIIDDLLQQAFPQRTTQEWFERLTERKHPAVMVPTMADLLRQTVHRERQAFVPVTLAGISFEAPVLPQRMDESGPLLGGQAPLLGEGNAYYRGAGLARLTQGPTDAAPTQTQPLAGTRVIDLTMGWAGPFATRMLADLGAEVIKVESTAYPDWWRGANYTDEFFRDRLYEKNTNFNLMARNKLGITLDLTQPVGKQLLKDLVRTADVVVENYSAEVLPKLGLDYQALQAVNPRLLMLSMPAFGLNNAWSNTRAYGGTLEQASGLPLYTGHTDGPPAMTSYAYGDPIGGFNASAALMLGLLLQKQGGRGRHINMSQVEGMLPLTSPFLIEQSLRGSVPERQGNLHPLHAPHGCYPCKGDDAWVVISVETDVQWRQLCHVLGRRDWLADSALSTAHGRRAARETVDAAIAAWTCKRSDTQAMQQLQAQAVPAGAVRTLTQLLQDEHLWQRGFWQQVSRDFIGSYTANTTIFRRGGQPMPVLHVAPTLGQHTRQVLRSLLGLDDEQLQALDRSFVIGTTAYRKGTKLPA